MAETQGDSAPAFRFKRRKIAHPRKAPDNAPAPAPALLSTDSSASAVLSNDLGSLPSSTPGDGEDENVPNLRDIIRQRKRPQDRLREAAKRVEERKAAAHEIEAGALVHIGAPHHQAVDAHEGGAESAVSRYTNRFVAQTGQIVDQEDEGMTAYVEARLAEKNHRLYGWPIPEHLKRFLGSSRDGATPTTSNEPPTAHPTPGQSTVGTPGTRSGNQKPGSDTRLAAGLGKLQEIDLGPEASARNLQRIEEARRKLEGLPEPVVAEENEGSRAPAKPEKRRRRNQRRNSEDLRRDMMVEAVMKEAKLEYFEEVKPASPPSNAPDADEAFYEQFMRDYENQEQRNQRKPAPPPAQKGVKEPPKGPKLGGSRSARAAMAKAQEEKEGKKR